MRLNVRISHGMGFEELFTRVCCGADGRDTHRWTDFVALSLDSPWSVLSAELMPKMDSGSRIADDVATVIAVSMPCRSERKIPCWRRIFFDRHLLEDPSAPKSIRYRLQLLAPVVWAVLADTHHAYHVAQ